MLGSFQLLQKVLCQSVWVVVPISGQELGVVLGEGGDGSSNTLGHIPPFKNLPAPFLALDIWFMFEAGAYWGFSAPQACCVMS